MLVSGFCENQGTPTSSNNKIVCFSKVTAQTRRLIYKSQTSVTFTANVRVLNRSAITTPTQIANSVDITKNTQKHTTNIKTFS